MENRGLSSPERRELHETGVSSIAWLDTLRPEDFRAAGIDIEGRREVHRRLVSVLAAQEDKEYAQRLIIEQTRQNAVVGSSMGDECTQAGRAWDDAEQRFVQAQQLLEEQELRVRDAEAQARVELRQREEAKAEFHQWLDQGALEFKEDGHTGGRTELSHRGRGIATAAITS